MELNICISKEMPFYVAISVFEELFKIATKWNRRFYKKNLRSKSQTCLQVIMSGDNS